MIRKSEGEEEEVFDLATMSFISSQLSCPSSPSGLGFGYEDDELFKFICLGFGYEDDELFKFICFPPSLPSPPLSPLWEFPNDPIPTKVNSFPQLPSCPFLNQLWYKYFYEDFTFHPESQHSFSNYNKAVITLIRGLPRVNDSINRLLRYKLSAYKSLSPTSEAEENSMIHLKAIYSMMQNMSLSSSVNIIPTKKHTIPRILQIEDELNMCSQKKIPLSAGPTEVIHSVSFSLDAETMTAVERDSEFSQTDSFFLNQNHESVTLKETAYGATEKLDTQVQRSVLKLDEIQGASGCESTVASLEYLQQHFNLTCQEASKSFTGQASTLSLETPNHYIGSYIIEATDDFSSNKAPMRLVEVTTSDPCKDEGLASNTINQKKRTNASSKSAITGSSISLEDLQQHYNMTREKAAESLGVSVSTLKRACRQHGISSWLHLKRRKKSESPSELMSMNITQQDNIASDFLTIKAAYANKMIKFKFHYVSEMAELEEQVAKMLKLKVGSFSMEYEDEDGDQIFLTSSEDVRLCIDSWKSQQTPIRMFVKLSTS